MDVARDPRAGSSTSHRWPGSCGVLDIYGHAAGGLLANGLAFSALFASIPAALLVLGVGGFIAAGSPEARDRLAHALIEAFPPLADLINGALTAVSRAPR